MILARKGCGILNNSSKELDFAELLSVFWKHKAIIVILAVLAAFVSYFYVYYSVPMYESSGVLYVSNKEVNHEEELTAAASAASMKSSDITASRSLVTSYLEILKTNDFLEKVTSDLGGAYTPKEIKGMLSMSSLNETELLSVRAVSPDPKTSYDVVNAVLKHAPETLIYVFDSGSAKVVDSPRMPQKPISKGLVRKTVLGFAIGAVLGCAIVFLMHFFDNKVHKASDLTQRYQLSVLGEIRR